MRPTLQKTWDLFSLVLVVFPLLTGGIWISRPGLFVELSDLGIPVLIVGLLGLLLIRFGYSLDGTWTVRMFLKAWEVWRRAVLRRPFLTLLLAATGVGGIWTLAAFRRHWALGSHVSDLGIYVNGLWNFTFGNGYVSIPNGNFPLMIDHQSPSFLLFAPIFYLFPYSETLLALQSMGLAMGGIAVYYLHRQYFEPAHRSTPSPAKASKKNPFHWSLFAAPWIYWAYLPIRNAYFSDFHPEVIGLSVLLGAIVGLQSQKKLARGLGLFGFIIAMGLKEAIPAVVVALGIAWLLGAGPLISRSFTKKIGVPIILLGLAVFYFDLSVVPRLYGHTGHLHQNEYSHFGSGLKGVLLAPFIQPIEFGSHLIGRERFKFLFWTLAPLGFLPILNPIGFILALPGYLLLFLSSQTYRITLIFHYAIIPAMGLFWALPGGIRRAEKWTSSRTVALWMLFWVLGANGRSDLFRIRNLAPTEHARWLTEAVFPVIQPDARLSVPDALVPQLANRHSIHTIPIIRDSGGNLIPCLFLDQSVHNIEIDIQTHRQLRESLPGLGYQSLVKCGEFEAFGLTRAPGEGEHCFNRLPECRETASGVR